jgi:hypothetical protein
MMWRLGRLGTATWVNGSRGYTLYGPAGAIQTARQFPGRRPEVGQRGENPSQLDARILVPWTSGATGQPPSLSRTSCYIVHQPEMESGGSGQAGISTPCHPPRTAARRIGASDALARGVLSPMRRSPGTGTFTGPPSKPAGHPPFVSCDPGWGVPLPGRAFIVRRMMERINLLTRFYPVIQTRSWC